MFLGGIKTYKGLSDVEFISRTQNKLLVVYNKEVYDLSQFQNKHPGGSSVIKDWKGKSVDNVIFNKAYFHHSKGILTKLNYYKVGILDDTPQVNSKQKNINSSHKSNQSQNTQQEPETYKQTVKINQQPENVVIQLKYDEISKEQKDKQQQNLIQQQNQQGEQNIFQVQQQQQLEQQQTNSQQQNMQQIQLKQQNIQTKQSINILNTQQISEIAQNKNHLDQQKQVQNNITRQQQEYQYKQKEQNGIIDTNITNDKIKHSEMDNKQQTQIKNNTSQTSQKQQNNQETTEDQFDDNFDLDDDYNDEQQKETSISSQKEQMIFKFLKISK